MTKEVAGCGLRVTSCGLRVTGYELRVFRDRAELATCNLFSALQLVIGLAVENEEFFVVVSRISAEG
jgi:hypothetical protein